VILRFVDAITIENFVNDVTKYINEIPELISGLTELKLVLKLFKTFVSIIIMTFHLTVANEVLFD
jgi:hypothetical protein